MKALLTHRMPGSGQAMLEAAGISVVVSDARAYSEASLAALVARHKPDAVISYLTDPITEKVLRAHGGLKIVSNYAVGYNNVDLDAARRAGVAVANAPVDGYSVAELTAALVVSLSRRIAEAHAYTAKGRYKGWDPDLFVGSVLQGKTLGLVGAGRIGSKAAEILSKGFGMKVAYSDAARNERLERETGAARMEVDDVFRSADVVSLHVPLTDETRHLVDERRLSLMKPDAFLINTARGPVVDERALVAALKDKAIAGAALDVFEFEPKVSAALRKLPNVVLTPHIGSATLESREEMSRAAAQNVIDFLSNKKPVGAILMP